jgi:hypothetical protein
MRQAIITISCLAAVAVFATIGCGPPGVVTQPLVISVPPASRCSIGEITDALPADVPDEKRPPAGDIAKFRKHLYKALQKKNLFTVNELEDSRGDLEVTGSILDYKRGSAFVRLITLGLAGKSKAVVALSLVDKNTDSVVFSVNRGWVIATAEHTGDYMFELIAKDFATALAYAIKNYGLDQQP